MVIAIAIIFSLYFVHATSSRVFLFDYLNAEKKLKKKPKTRVADCPIAFKRRPASKRKQIIRKRRDGGCG